MELLKLAKSELLRSNVDNKHPFRCFSLGTMDVFPEVRTVIKRAIDDDFKVTFFTDARTPKQQQISINNKVAALFYHPEMQLQIRLKGVATIIKESDKDFQYYLQQVKSSGRITDYSTEHTPGQVLGGERAEMSEILCFSMIVIAPVFMDILLLDKEGHQRVSCSRNQGLWSAKRIIP